MAKSEAKINIDTKKLGGNSVWDSRIDLVRLEKLQPKMVGRKTFKGKSVIVPRMMFTDANWLAIARQFLAQQAKIEGLEEENKELKGNQRPFTMPDIDAMTAKEDGTHRFRRRK